MSAFDSIPWLATYYPDADTALRAQEAAAAADPLSVTLPADFQALAAALEGWRTSSRWYDILADSIFSHYSAVVIKNQVVIAGALPVPTTSVVEYNLRAGGFLTACVGRGASWYITNTAAADISGIAAGVTADAASLESRLAAGMTTHTRSMLVLMFGDPVRPDPLPDTSKTAMRTLLFDTMGFAAAFNLFSLPLPY